LNTNIIFSRDNLRGALKHIILIFISIFALFPFVWILLTSFKNKIDVYAIPPKWIFEPIISNFKDIFVSDFLGSLLNSVFISSIVTIIVIFLGLLAAYAFSRYEIKSKGQFFFFVLTTRMGPPVAFVLPFFMIFTRFKLIDKYPSLILTYILMNLAFAIWMMKGFIDGIPVELEEAAKIDGCSTLRTIFKITLPLSKSGIFATAVFTFILTWNEFFYALNLTRYESRTFTVVLPTYMSGTSFPQWEQMCAASVILSLPVLIMSLVISKHLVKGLTLGAVKG
jgi:multiple sugar transport system permease protein